VYDYNFTIYGFDVFYLRVGDSRELGAARAYVPQPVHPKLRPHIRAMSTLGHTEPISLPPLYPQHFSVNHVLGHRRTKPKLSAEINREFTPKREPVSSKYRKQKPISFVLEKSVRHSTRSQDVFDQKSRCIQRVYSSLPRCLGTNILNASRSGT